jgi:hypothetical protein
MANRQILSLEWYVEQLLRDTVQSYIATQLAKRFERREEAKEEGEEAKEIGTSPSLYIG